MTELGKYSRIIVAEEVVAGRKASDLVILESSGNDGMSCDPGFDLLLGTGANVPFARLHPRWALPRAMK